MTTNGFRDPLTLRPWPRDESERTALPDILARVNLERGHFRDITEASLQEEIAADGGLDVSESDEDDEDEDEEEEKEAKHTQVNSREELFKAKHEMLSFVAQAEQDVLKSLDFISLLESAHNTNGNVTVSQVLKQSVPLGSLGTDIWHRMPEDKTRRAQEDLIATSVRLQGLQKSADALLSAAARLEDNARKEAKYWDEILAISEKGWSVSRIQQRSHLLGVHFGFSGSLPQFARRDLAALVVTADGDITLERGIGTKPTALRAVVKRNGRIVGSSRLPRTLDQSETTLDVRIRYARDSLYDEELNHELVRESRALGAMDVRLQGSEICFSGSHKSSPEQQEISLELVTLDAIPGLAHDATHSHDHLAEAVLLTARLLLGQAHRERLRQKASVPPPMSDKKEEPPQFPILRPLVWFARHYANVQLLNESLERAAGVLGLASINFRLEKLPLSVPELTTAATSEALVTALLHPRQSSASLVISTNSADEPLAVKLVVDTSLSNLIGSLFTISAPTSPRPHEYQDPVDTFAAFDSLIAEALTRVLADVLGSEWRCSPRQLCVQRLFRGASSEHAAYIEVELDSKAGVLALKSSSESVKWNLSGAADRRTFAEAAKALASSSD